MRQKWRINQAFLFGLNLNFQGAAPLILEIYLVQRTLVVNFYVILSLLARKDGTPHVDL